VASTLLVCAGLVAGASPQPSDVPGPGAGGPAAALGDCVAIGFGDTVEELNDMVAAAAGVPEFLGADVGVDVWLSGKRSLWLFADTLQQAPSGHVLVRNSMLLFTPGCAQVVKPAGGGAVVPDRDDGVGYWPMSVWKLDRGGATTVYAMFQRVAWTLDDAAASGFRFVTLGPTLAVFRMAGSGAPQLMNRVDLGADNPSREAPEWGAASALDGGWLYLYGTSTRELPGLHGFALRVARVRPERVADLSHWRYWDGLHWATDPEDAVPLIEEQGGVSQTLSVWPQDGRWYVLSKQDEYLGRQVAVWPGDSPVGPFGPPQAVADIPCDPVTGELRYMPLAHPGLLPEAGTVVVAYSRNYVDLAQVCAPPPRYRPYFVRVTLPD
jgi:hypothetical protein